MYNFVAVCGFGLGSSMVLKMTVEKVARERGIEVEVETLDLSSAKGTKADAVFTSKDIGKELKESTASPVYPINRFTDKEEIGAALDDFLGKQGA